MIFTKRNSPRWLVFLLDLGISAFSLLIAFSLRFNFAIPYQYIANISVILPVFLGIRALSFAIGKTYAGIVRYTSIKDTERILAVISFGSIALAGINLLFYSSLSGGYLIPFSVLIIDFITTVYLMTASRLLVKFVYGELVHAKKDRTNVIIYGSKELAILTKRALEMDSEAKYRVVAFIDHNASSIIRKKIEGLFIYFIDKFEQIVDKYNVTTLIFAKNNLKAQRKSEVVQRCLEKNIKVLTVPDIQSWINGRLSVNQIRKIKIEDLLERDPIELDTRSIKKELINKTIMVTGAAGSIGSEIVRQIIKYNPRKVLLLDQAETPLYDIELEIREQKNLSNIEVLIGDITNHSRMVKIFEQNKPDIIYHAAAYKHVPMMESNPVEAIQNNVFGTKIIADLAIKHKVDKFVMISTDKAVNPTNIMGASKRIAEIYIQSLNGHCQTNFITTRFGNVLGSNGSVIPRFRKQIEQGGPVTVTHPEVTRYFMTIPEACQLVLEASAMGQGGEIFVFDMGKSIKVADLAKNMIKLSGLEIGKDIHLKYIGLRPGEKLYEELLSDKENTLPTHHPKIMRARVRDYNYKEVLHFINKFIFPLKGQDHLQVVKLMKEIVPEFRSQNSVYEELDLRAASGKDTY